MDGKNIAPYLVANIEEGGRIIGFLLDSVRGRHPCQSDHQACIKAIEALHDTAGVVHGDLHNGNIIMDDGYVWLLDFETATQSEDEGARQNDYDKLEADLFDDM